MRSRSHLLKAQHFAEDEAWHRPMNSFAPIVYKGRSECKRRTLESRIWHDARFMAMRRLMASVAQKAIKRGEEMKNQANFVERRAHARVGVMAQLEDITYGILRKHGVVSGPARNVVAIAQASSK